MNNFKGIDKYFQISPQGDYITLLPAAVRVG